jgi:hypothetical protein
VDVEMSVRTKPLSIFSRGVMVLCIDIASSLKTISPGMTGVKPGLKSYDVYNYCVIDHHAWKTMA